MIKTILITCCLLSVFLLACTKTETTNSTPTATPATKATSTPAAVVATTAGNKVGVAECDAFIEAYETCVNNKVPAAVRATFNTSLATWRKQWRELAANPQTKPTLVQACKTQLETAKTSMKSYGCTF
ncbi:MAG: hypothetical protein M3R68_06405 [Acidobacteriota bacterium]|nr:hypothetical protein [Acidobacteriota bacterium]